ncbi:coiled-coil domain-containing protein 80 [Acipenser oxyrinchus oxyrinchus]|uniref:Coiled-coil domain-containing protein 80 n=1 Tax=Acipenser oxyrinchus oxyrinchus TaxID=40147 RepID=A0AAD8GK24_ACIOX|nr:coiled-coil domain-containing protein 80 [Acipenser oxyrinchus oxyrinchus]
MYGLFHLKTCANLKMQKLFILLLLFTIWYNTSGASRSQKNRFRTPASKTQHAGTSGAGSREPSVQDGQTLQSRNSSMPILAVMTGFDFLAEFAGKHRLWVITAPTFADNYYRMMEKQIEETQTEGLVCKLAERDTFIVILIHNAMMEGKLRKTTHGGEVTEEIIDQDTVTKLMHYLSFEDGKFGMLILKKNLQVGERFPYPVRIEAVLETIDQLPLRKLEKLTRRGALEKCNISKRLVKRRQGSAVRKVKVINTSRQSNHTLLNFKHKRLDNQKAALKSKVQDILKGRSRFVIKSPPRVVSAQQAASVRQKSFINPKTRSSLPRTVVLTNVTSSRRKQKHNGDDVVYNSSKSLEATSFPTRSPQQLRNLFTSNIHSTAAPPTKKDRKHKKESRKLVAQNTLPSSNISTAVSDKDSSKDKANGREGKKNRKKGGRKSQRATVSKTVQDFLEHFRNKRRLLIISSPSKENLLYVQQRDENVEHTCELALRKISVITILGTELNSTLKLDHYQPDKEVPFGSTPNKLVDLDLIAQIRKDYKMVYNEFFMVVTDYDLTLKQYFDVPVAMKLMMDYIDSFPSRLPEIGKEKSDSNCDPQTNSTFFKIFFFIVRFHSKRRLLIISSPNEEEYSFQQQVTAMNGQSCNFGIRHFAVLKLIGAGPEASASLDLFPVNGKSQSEHEELTTDVVKGLREHFKISEDYFAMLMIGKDGLIKSWYPAPMWSMAIVYDLVDSMQLRQEEEKLQSSLGIHCPEE